MFRKRAPLVLTCLIFLLGLAAPAAGVGLDPFPLAASSYLVKLNGELLWEHAPDLRLPPASLTKVMTSLLVLERGRLDDVAVVGKAAALETGSRLGLRAGERLRVSELLTATLVDSSNDACHVLADYISGSEAEFVALMNRRAEELGMKNTRFSNACGHDEPIHYSTARDLALLAEAALKHRAFRETVRLGKAVVRTERGRKIRISTKNKLIDTYPGAVGVKTGYTPKAGKCLIALAEREGASALIVLLNSPKRWEDAALMLDHAFITNKLALGAR